MAVTKIHAALATLALMSLALPDALALEAPVSIRANWGVAVESLQDPKLSGKVSTPSLNFNLGAAVSMPLSAGSRFSFDPAADFYYSNYELSSEGQPVPTAQEFGSAFMLGLLLDAPLVYSFPLGRGFSLGLGLGLCLDVRVAFTLDAAYFPENTPLMNRYFWDQGRFLTPSTRLRVDYALAERVSFGFSGRVYWPIYNLWTGEGYGFFDQGLYLINLTIVYKLDKPKL